jgi:hypothetical protein
MEVTLFVTRRTDGTCQLCKYCACPSMGFVNSLQTKFGILDSEFWMYPKTWMSSKGDTYIIDVSLRLRKYNIVQLYRLRLLIY